MILRKISFLKLRFCLMSGKNKYTALIGVKRKQAGKEADLSLNGLKLLTKRSRFCNLIIKGGITVKQTVRLRQL